MGREETRLEAEGPLPAKPEAEAPALPGVWYGEPRQGEAGPGPSDMYPTP